MKKQKPQCKECGKWQHVNGVMGQCPERGKRHGMATSDDCFVEQKGSGDDE